MSEDLAIADTELHDCVVEEHDIEALDALAHDLEDRVVEAHNHIVDSFDVESFDQRSLEAFALSGKIENAMRQRDGSILHAAHLLLSSDEDGLLFQARQLIGEVPNQRTESL